MNLSDMLYPFGILFMLSAVSRAGVRRQAELLKGHNRYYTFKSYNMIDLFVFDIHSGSYIEVDNGVEGTFFRTHMNKIEYVDKPKRKSNL